MVTISLLGYFFMQLLFQYSAQSCAASIELKSMKANLFDNFVSGSMAT